MKTKALLLALCSLLFAATAHAQWQTSTYTLKGGWNAIYLHGAADYTTIDTLLPNTGVTANVLEVWRWNPNPNQVQFTSSPLVPTAGTAEWSTWVRGGSANTLSTLTGQTAYLVRCTGTTSNSYSVPITQRMLPPSSTWVRNGANLLGFPTFKNGSSFPFFSTYFATFPSAIAANTKIFKYAGGDLSTTNPVQVFSPTTERLDRNAAYWFDAKVVGDFYAPMQISLSLSNGLDFGRTGTVMTAHLLNRTSANVTLTIAPVASETAPSGQESLSNGLNNVSLPTGSVPITLRTFNTSTALWTETLIQSSFTVVVPASGALDVNFGIQRTAMTGASNAFYASLLRLTDSGNLFDIYLPVLARKTSLAGLWIGDATVGAVESKPEADAITATGSSYPLRYILHVADDGTARMLSQVCIGKLATPPNDLGICTKEVGLNASDKASATRIVAAHMPLDRVLDGVADLPNEPVAGSGSVAVPGTLTRVVSIPFDDISNPFVHQYHPDHDNKSPPTSTAPNGTPLVNGQESYSIKRTIAFTFTSAPPGGGTISGWGNTIIGGTYQEVISGLHKDDLTVTGTFQLQRASELGSITVNP